MSQMYLITTVNAFSGLSTEEKQIAGGVKNGSTYHERDTGKIFRFLQGEWVEDDSVPLSIGEFIAGNADIKVSLELLGSINTTLKKIEYHLSIATDTTLEDQDV